MKAMGESQNARTAATPIPTAQAVIPDRPALAVALMVGSLCLLALQDSLVKLASSEVSLWQFQVVRSSCNAVLLLLVLRLVWSGGTIRPRRLWAVSLRSLCHVGAMVFFFGGVPFLNLSDIAAGLYVFPLFVVLLSAVFLGEAVGPRRIGAALAGLAGTLLILKPGTASFQWVGLMPVIAAFWYALTILITRKLCREESPAALNFALAVVFMALGVLGIGAASLWAPPDLAASWPYLFTGWRDLAPWVLVLILVCSGLNLAAGLGLAKAYQSAESSWLVPFDYSYLIFATFWGAVMWSHLPDAWSFLGMGLIAGAGCYVALRERAISRARAAQV
jgi:drug/metabolite transporter (DMT)-like permease